MILLEFHTFKRSCCRSAQPPGNEETTQSPIKPIKMRLWLSVGSCAQVTLVFTLSFNSLKDKISPPLGSIVVSLL